MKKVWKIAPQNPRLNQRLAQALDSSPLFTQVLINRGFDTEEKARLFLRAKLSQLHSPFLFRDMERALNLIERAIEKKELILIYGDYDVDGITATTILYKSLNLLGAKVTFYIPNRIKEGYGLNKKAVEKAAGSGTKLIITCDCGTNDWSVLNFAKERKLDIIITDHHAVYIEPFPEFPLINPKRKDSTYPYPDLAGVGVIFKLVQALLDKFNFKDKERWEIEHLDLVALGTIADAVPFTGENRIIIKHGLKRIAKSSNFGIQALKEVAGLKSDLSLDLNCQKVSFILAPRINAAGRLAEGSLGVKLLTAPSFEAAMNLARMMDGLNRKRQNIQEAVLKEALDKIDKEINLEKEKIILLSSPKWHLGVVGIVASRLVEKFLRPVFLISLDEISRGSARSVNGFPLHEVLAECKEHLINFGGHKYAAGLTISQEKIPFFHQKLRELGEYLIPEESFSSEWLVDGVASLEEISPLLLNHLRFLAPFGPGNPAPIFLSRMLKLENFPRIVGKNHLKFMVREDNNIREVIGFKFGGHLERLLPADRKVDIIYYPEVNQWQGEAFIQSNLKDLKVVR